MDRTRQGRWWALALVGGVLGGGGCERQEDKVSTRTPSADDREVRSALFRDLVASRERAPDLEAWTGPDAQGRTGQGGSGRPAPTGSVSGRVEWVGDNELLIRDSGGQERDVEVTPDTLLRLNGKQVGLASMREGDSVEVTYDDGPGGWVARDVEVVIAQEPLIPTERELGRDERDKASSRP
ncbi:hypothetical protein HUA78_22790 [Myxococcus sp. CA033]|uniref:hypothetical protein n=1 Tax=Myxococcus sp. CA033 TaxID=2741516 RepID=UPI00157BA4A9|nr:hypothetical protein [Myxococcus sp. CA033]NTX37284.1 hypothetical protein [Myxococcus sp. CA033]